MDLLTASSLSFFVVNPARSSVRDFRFVVPSSTQSKPGKSSAGKAEKTERPERAHMVRQSDGRKICFLIFGRVAFSSILTLNQMGQSGSKWYNKTIQIQPIAVEYALACSFFTNILGVSSVGIYGGVVIISTFPTELNGTLQSLIDNMCFT